MDDILYKASNQAMSFAIKSGISLASGFAIKRITKLLDKLPDDDTSMILKKRKRISTKISIISSSIELIKLISAQGNSALASTMELIEELEESFETFDQDVEAMIQDLNGNGDKQRIIKNVEKKMNELIEEIDESVPLINLSLITCSVNRNGVSLSKLIKASNYLEKNTDPGQDKDDGEDAKDEAKEINVGPPFSFKFYSIFYNPSRLENGGSQLDCISWKEKYAKAIVQISKDPYNITITEDFNDGRYHDDEDEPEKKVIKLEDIGKLFFTSSGKILRLDNNLPVLILKLGEDYVGFGAHDISLESDSETEEEGEEPEIKVIEGDRDLSLFEYLIKLLKLEKTENKAISSINDEKLSIYLGINKEMDNNIMKLDRLSLH
ncbi:ran-specific GTPase-activating protein 30 [[Candida] jaroonii]|uniref:Ran-specific GTPase-activating protein 30 n=1 Tax=[Candida] jaroonii TaxID=467808 RepID=A0ACA9Y9J3_9ASCO|nr:ran-specific GTPase-activating protein 30 [[Candida] jaroonii]